jgi:hypothetical protein
MEKLHYNIFDQIESGFLKGVIVKFVLSNIQKVGILDKPRNHYLKSIYLSRKR